ncbi:MAG: thermonuclease family protein [Alphaproteobacteria bacterium]|nr:thermonuclease family protein [Alphaproteobacteria bacterium]
MTRRKAFLKYLIVLMAAVLAAYRIDHRQRVVDGDTLVIGREKIRLKNIDAPERKQTCVCNGKKTKCGVEAKKALSGFIKKKNVSCFSSGRDTYGRLLAECFITAGNEKISLNALMIREGMAVVTSKHDETLLIEESNALREKKGVWGCEKFEMPAGFRKSAQRERSI